jgi:outer membrane biosynthesis protein TonB
MKATEPNGQARTMTALIKNTDTTFAAGRATAPASAGFGPLTAPVANAKESIRRAVMTMLLVLYPAMASAAVVIAALVYSGARPIV